MHNDIQVHLLKVKSRRWEPPDGTNKSIMIYCLHFSLLTSVGGNILCKYLENEIWAGMNIKQESLAGAKVSARQQCVY